MSDQRPPDLDANGQPVTGKPPDLDAKGNPVSDAGFLAGIGETLPTPSKIMGFLRSIPQTLADRTNGTRDLVTGQLNDPNAAATEQAHTPIGKIRSGRPMEGLGNIAGIGGQLLVGEAAPKVVGRILRGNEPPPPPNYLDKSQPIRPSELTPQQLKERIQNGYGTPPPVNRGPVRRSSPQPHADISDAAVPTEATTPPTKSPQQMLNEEALARRRAAYQASQNDPVVAAETFRDTFNLPDEQSVVDQVLSRNKTGRWGSETGATNVDALMQMFGLPAAKYGAAAWGAKQVGLPGWTGVAGMAAAQHPQMTAQALRAALLAQLAGSGQP